MRFRLADEGKVFSTRARGARVRMAVIHLLSEQDEVTVDFEEVVTVSYSFADEFIGKMFAEGHPRVSLRNMNETVERTIRKSLANREVVQPIAA